MADDVQALGVIAHQLFVRIPRAIDDLWLAMMGEAEKRPEIGEVVKRFAMKIEIEPLPEPVVTQPMAVVAMPPMVTQPIYARPKVTVPSASVDTSSGVQLTPRAAEVASTRVERPARRMDAVAPRVTPPSSEIVVPRADTTPGIWLRAEVMRLSPLASRMKLALISAIAGRPTLSCRSSML